MAIIIDGYNVLHTSRWLTSSWKGVDRRRFCMLLAQLASHRDEKITVVFDAEPTGSSAVFSPPVGLEVIYSGHSRTADDLIIQMVNSSTGPRHLTVVSSDRQVAAAARSAGAKVVSSDTFAALIQTNHEGESGGLESDADLALSSAEVDDWLALFNQATDEK